MKFFVFLIVFSSTLFSQEWLEGDFDSYEIESGDTLESIIEDNFSSTKIKELGVEVLFNILKDNNPHVKDWSKLIVGERIFIDRPASSYLSFLYSDSKVSTSEKEISTDSQIDLNCWLSFDVEVSQVSTYKKVEQNETIAGTNAVFNNNGSFFKAFSAEMLTYSCKKDAKLKLGPSLRYLLRDNESGQNVDDEVLAQLKILYDRGKGRLSYYFLGGLETVSLPFSHQIQSQINSNIYTFNGVGFYDFILAGLGLIYRSRSKKFEQRYSLLAQYIASGEKRSYIDNSLGGPSFSNSSSMESTSSVSGQKFELGFKQFFSKYIFLGLSGEYYLLNNDDSLMMGRLSFGVSF